MDTSPLSERVWCYCTVCDLHPQGDGRCYEQIQDFPHQELLSAVYALGGNEAVIDAMLDLMRRRASSSSHDHPQRSARAEPSP